MDATVELRRRLDDRLQRLTPERMERAVKVLKSIGLDASDPEADAPLSSDVLTILHKIATGTMPPRLTRENRAQRWIAYHATLTPAWLGDTIWMLQRKGAPSPALAARLRTCKANGWPRSKIGYVRPSEHYGTSVGKGFFALLALPKGQMLMQFTGRLYKDTKAFDKGNRMRRDYSIGATYGTHKLRINPLREDDAAIDDHNPVGYINEPSALPKRRLPPSARDVSRANVDWIDFPVPLPTLYRATRKKKGTFYVFRRRLDASIVPLEWHRSTLSSNFTSFTDCRTGIFKAFKGMHVHIKPGYVLFMHEERFRGLERYGLVTTVKRDTIIVQHYVLHTWSWRLPRRVLAGKLHTCAACRKGVDDPACANCVMVPFPLVLACRDIAPDDELLCVYAQTIASRGARCPELADDEYRPSWRDY